MTLRNTLQFYIAKAAVKRWGASVFVTLYEGQPWEQPAWLGAKAAGQGCLTVGYQHTVIMRHSLSLLHRELPGPDYVLCLGETPRAMLLKHGHAQRETRLVSFGSFRWAPDGQVPRPPSPRRQVILVVPETGVLREAKLLFNVAMRAAALLPEHRIIFRCHPFTPFARLQAHLDQRPEAFPNIEVSDRRSISEDFARSSVLLYRGSSAVLYAVLFGLKPVYLHDPHHPEVDPLFELEAWRERVSGAEELASIARRYASAADAETAGEWQAAAAYVRAYTGPVSEASIDGFVTAVGLSRPRDGAASPRTARDPVEGAADRVRAMAQ